MLIPPGLESFPCLPWAATQPQSSQPQTTASIFLCPELVVKWAMCFTAVYSSINSPGKNILLGFATPELTAFSFLK
jgi:hypothetical protein